MSTKGERKDTNNGGCGGHNLLNHHHSPCSPDELKRAIEVYDRTINNFKSPKEKIILCLLGRSDCSAQLNKHDTVVADSKRILKMLAADPKDTATTSAGVRRRLIFALYKTKKISQAEDVVQEWLSKLQTMSCDEKQRPQKTICVLERYLSIFRLYQGEKDRLKQSIYDSEVSTLNDKLDNWIKTSLPPDRLTDKVAGYSAGNKFLQLSNSSTSPTSSTSSSISSNVQKGTTTATSLNTPYTKTEHSRSNQTVNSSSVSSSTSSTSNNSQNQLHRKLNSLDLADGGKGYPPPPDAGTNMSHVIQCTYCALVFQDRSALKAHCQTESHQIVIMSDEGEIYLFNYNMKELN